MSQPSTGAAAVTRPRWPFAGQGQKPLLLASVLMIVGSLLPWVMTPLGTINGSSGGGLLSLYAAFLGLAGAMVKRRGLALAQAVLTGLGGAGVALWQLARIASLSAETDAWGTMVPGVGLLFVLASGLLAFYAAYRLHGEAR